MKTVRITQTPRGRSQEVVPGVPLVSQTITGSPEGTGTIEAEGGESIVGDVNRDGMLEHMRILGPSHGGGGVELDVDAGSFVFSNSKKLRVRDPETLARFTTGASKKGKTPAEIARQYDVNTHVQTLKNDSSSPLAKKTAQLMLDTTSQKLAELAFLQESLKGFPTGVPLIAQQLLGLDAAGQPVPEQQDQQASSPSSGPDAQLPADPLAPGGPPQMRYGGELTKFLDRGEVKPGHVARADSLKRQAFMADSVRQAFLPMTQDNTPTDPSTGQPASQTSGSYHGAAKVGDFIYVNGEKVKVTAADVRQSLLPQNNKTYIELANGQRLTQKDWNALHSGKSLNLGSALVDGRHGDNSLDVKLRREGESHPGVPTIYSTKPEVPTRKLAGDLYAKKGDALHFAGVDYSIVDPWAEKSADYGSSGASWRNTFTKTGGVVAVKQKDSDEVEYLNLSDLKAIQSTNPDQLRTWDPVKLRNEQRDAKLRQNAAKRELTFNQLTPAQQQADLYGPADPEPAQVAAPAPAPHPATTPTGKAPAQIVHTRPAPSARPVPHPGQAPSQPRATPSTPPAPAAAPKSASQADADFDAI